jgi:hypothetical protein
MRLEYLYGKFCLFSPLCLFPIFHEIVMLRSYLACGLVEIVSLPSEPRYSSHVRPSKLIKGILTYNWRDVPKVLRTC